MRALAKRHPGFKRRRGAFKAFIGISPQSRPDTIGQRVANKANFFMSIPSHFHKPADSGAPGACEYLTETNSEPAQTLEVLTGVKQKVKHLQI